MRGLLSTLTLVVVLAGLGAYIYFVDSKRPAAGVEEKPKVFTVESDKIEEITITSDAETSTLKKIDGTWRMTAPVTTDADQTEVSTLTSSLSTLEVNRVVDENTSNLADFGLAEPHVKVAFKAADGVAGELYLGDKTATQSDVYAVKPGDKRVFLVQAFHETAFAKKPFDLRDKRILKFERDKVDSIELAHDEANIQLARTGTDWVVKQPVQARGDYSAIEALLTRLSSAAMTKLVEAAPEGQTKQEGGTSVPPSPSLAKYGLDKPAVIVTIGAGSARATLALGKEDDGALFARDESRGMVFTVDPTLAADLSKPVGEYRDKDIFEFRGFSLSRLQISRGAETYEFQKVTGAGESAAEKWQRVVAGGSPTDVDTLKMDDVLAGLTSLRAQSFQPTRQKTGLDQPALTVSASYDGGKFERVRMARTTDAFAARDEEPGAAVLDATAYDDMLKALDALVAPPAPAPAP